MTKVLETCLDRHISHSLQCEYCCIAQIQLGRVPNLYFVLNIYVTRPQKNRLLFKKDNFQTHLIDRYLNICWQPQIACCRTSLISQRVMGKLATISTSSTKGTKRAVIYNHIYISSTVIIYKTSETFMSPSIENSEYSCLLICFVWSKRYIMFTFTISSYKQAKPIKRKPLDFRRRLVTGILNCTD